MDRIFGRNEGRESRDFTEGRRYGERPTQASRNRYEFDERSAYERDYNVRRNPPPSSTRGFDYNIDEDERLSFHRSDRGFFGKGPKGWKRSDERIKEEVSEALYRDYHVDASDIEVDVKDGVVTLSGTVDSRESKRSAEECIEHLSGVSDVHNRIRIQDNSKVTNLRNRDDSDEKRALS